MPHSKRKGYYNERKVVTLLNEAGIPAERVPLSGALGRVGGMDLRGDIDIMDMKAEVKARANGQGFTVLEKWKKDNDVLILRRDRQDPMVCMDWDVYIKLMRAYVAQHGAIDTEETEG